MARSAAPAELYQVSIKELRQKLGSYVPMNGMLCSLGTRMVSVKLLNKMTEYSKV